MRLNIAPQSGVTPTETRPRVGAVRAAKPVGPQTAGSGATAPASTESAKVPAAPVPVAERRAGGRRGNDRRQNRVAVLIDTRVGDRRKRRRRVSDEAPAAVDLEA